MIDLTDSCLKESRSETRTRSAGNLFQRTTEMGKMNTGSNRQMREFVCRYANSEAAEFAGALSQSDQRLCVWYL